MQQHKTHKGDAPMQQDKNNRKSQKTPQNPQKTKSIPNIPTNKFRKEYTHATNPYVH